MKVAVVAIILLWLAGGCQQAVSGHWGIGGVEPDFLLIAVGVLGPFASRRGATALGFCAGVIHGAVSGATLAAYAVSRTIAGFLIGWFADMELEASPLMAFVATFFLTLIASLVLMFIAPPGAILPYLGATIGSALYNGVLAVPLHLVLRRVFRDD